MAVLIDAPAAAYGLDDVRAMPEDTGPQREAKAAALRALFQRSVEQERFYRSVLNHVVGLTVNAGLAAILYFGFKLGGRALLTLIAGTLEWETQIFTRPTAALDLATASAHPEKRPAGTPHRPHPEWPGDRRLVLTAPGRIHRVGPGQALIDSPLARALGNARTLAWSARCEQPC